MYIIKNFNSLYCNRGDTFILPFTINRNTQLNPVAYELTDTDEVYIRIREINQSFEDSIIKQVVTSRDRLQIYLTPSMTENLPTGKYILEIKLIQHSDIDVVTTVLESTEFFIVGSNKTQERS